MRLESLKSCSYFYFVASVIKAASSSARARAEGQKVNFSCATVCKRAVKYSWHCTVVFEIFWHMIEVVAKLIMISNGGQCGVRQQQWPSHPLPPVPDSPLGGQTLLFLLWISEPFFQSTFWSPFMTDIWQSNCVVYANLWLRKVAAKKSLVNHSSRNHITPVGSHK